MVNLRPYLGAQEKESRQGVPLAQDVVLRLVSPVKSKGYNITTDNFFTSVVSAEKLEAIATTVVGTVRANSKDIKKAMTAPVKGGTNESTFYYNDKHHCLFVNYQCKIKKSVCLLSTIYNSSSVDDSAKNKQDVILFYKNKVGGCSQSNGQKVFNPLCFKAVASCCVVQYTEHCRTECLHFVSGGNWKDNFTKKFYTSTY